MLAGGPESSWALLQWFHLRKTEAYSMRIAKYFIVGGMFTVSVAAGAFPATAAPTDDTTVTFDVAAGSLDIVASATADLGEGTPGTAINGSLGAVTVTDSRASADASWEATAISTVFQTGGGTPAETVLASEVDYWSGAATATTGDGTFTPGQATLGAAEPLNTVTPLPVFTHTGGTGNNTATWAPSLSVHLPLDSQAGTYTGTVTHSVA
jgi:hypothetical protein